MVKHPERKTITGRILAVQEYRFRLAADDGRALLFTMNRFANIDLDQLCQMQKDSAHIKVEYEGEPDLESSTAHHIWQI